jgi:hypothetical protein
MFGAEQTFATGDYCMNGLFGCRVFPMDESFAVYTKEWDKGKKIIY